MQADSLFRIILNKNNTFNLYTSNIQKKAAQRQLLFNKGSDF